MCKTSLLSSDHKKAPLCDLQSGQTILKGLQLREKKLQQRQDRQGYPAYTTSITIMYMYGGRETENIFSHTARMAFREH